MTLAVATISNPEREHFLKDLFQSLAQQTYKDFKVLVCRETGTDDIPLRRILYPLTRAPNRMDIILHEIPARTCQSAYTSRKAQLDFAQTQCDTVILLDDDDTVPPNFIANMLAYKQALKTDVVACDVHAFHDGVDPEKSYYAILSKRFSPGQELSEFDFIDKSAIGLGHTLINTAALKDADGHNYYDEVRPDVVFDGWDLFPRMLADGKTASFTGPGVYMNYRQHICQLTGGLLSPTPTKIRQQIFGKAKHYACIQQSHYISAPRRTQYARLSKIFSAMAQRVATDEHYTHPAYASVMAKINYVEKDTPLLWWEAAKPDTDIALPKLA